MHVCSGQVTCRFGGVSDSHSYPKTKERTRVGSLWAKRVLCSLAFHASMPHASMPACLHVFMSPLLHLCILLPIGPLLIHTCFHSLHLFPSFTCPSIELDRFSTETHHLLTVPARTVQSKSSAERSLGDGRRDTGGSRTLT